MIHAARIEKLRRLAEELKLEALLIDNPIDLFYLTGLHVSLGRLVVSADRAALFVDGRYFETAKKNSFLEVILSSAESLIQYLGSKSIVGIDSAFLTVDAFESLKQQIPGKQWVCIFKPLKELRAIKATEEIEALRRAAKLTWGGYQEIVSRLKEGVSEEELAFEFEFFCKKKGASALSFSPIIAFGENSAYPHHRAGKTKLEKNQIVLIDVGAVVDEYRGDMTRVVFFGAPEPKLQHFLAVATEAQRRAVAAIRPGIAFGEIDKIAREYLQSEGLESLFTHGLSHGIGLETHEYPSLRIKGGDQGLILRSGMVFTVEPGIYLPGLGGVRYEDTVRVTELGVENFFADLGGLK